MRHLFLPRGLEALFSASGASRYGGLGGALYALLFGCSAWGATAAPAFAGGVAEVGLRTPGGGGLTLVGGGSDAALGGGSPISAGGVFGIGLSATKT